MLTGVPPSEFSDCLRKAEKAGVKGAVFAIWTTRIKSVTAAVLSEIASRINPPFSRRFSLEDLHFLSTEPLSCLEAIPLEYVGLTWNGENALAGGVGSDKGLTPLGKAVLKKIEKIGIALDTAHLNEKSFFETLENFRGRTLCSHCCLKSVFDCPRNLTDGQISAIVARGGIVGLTAERTFVSAYNRNLSGFLRHVDYFAEKFGCESLSIGTDFYGCRPIDGLGSYADFSRLKEELLRRKYPERAIDGIFFENALKFFNGDTI